MNSYSEFWDAVCNYCKENMNSIAFNMWIEPLKLIKLESERVIIAAPGFKIELIMDKYRQLIEEAFYNILGFNVEIELIPFENVPKEINEEVDKKEDSFFSNIENTKLTFNNFIVGPSNKFAYTASLRVAETPGSVFNPLFIYGNSGLGKTHLLNAIIEKIKSNKPDANILYIHNIY